MKRTVRDPAGRVWTVRRSWNERPKKRRTGILGDVSIVLDLIDAAPAVGRLLHIQPFKIIVTEPGGRSRQWLVKGVIASAARRRELARKIRAGEPV